MEIWLFGLRGVSIISTTVVDGSLVFCLFSSFCRGESNGSIVGDSTSCHIVLPINFNLRMLLEVVLRLSLKAGEMASVKFKLRGRISVGRVSEGLIAINS